MLKTNNIYSQLTPYLSRIPNSIHHYCLILTFPIFGVVQLCVGQEKCGTDYYQYNSDYLPHSSAATATAHPRSTFDINVVFHIFTLIGEEPIDSKVILDQIDILNNDYQGTSVSPNLIFQEIREFLGSPSISFCLASLDPIGNNTNGIIYYSTPHPDLADQEDSNGSRAIKHFAMGGADAWDTKSYLNIWLGNREVFLGDSTFPDDVGNDEDGIVIDGDVIGSHVYNNARFERGKTLVHEVGHYLGLRHIWGTGDECISDDGIMDTPLQLGPYFDCPSYPQESCGSMDFIYNFMDFSNDICLLYFTKGQVDVLHNTLSSPRAGLADIPCRPISTESDLDQIILRMSGKTLYLISDNNDRVMDLTVSVFDMTGRRLSKDRVNNRFIHHIELEIFSFGIYLVLLENENDYSIRKIYILNN